jgi:hypothetical protein
MPGATRPRLQGKVSIDSKIPVAVAKIVTKLSAIASVKGKTEFACVRSIPLSIVALLVGFACNENFVPPATFRVSSFVEKMPNPSCPYTQRTFVNMPTPHPHAHALS